MEKLTGDQGDQLKDVFKALSKDVPKKGLKYPKEKSLTCLKEFLKWFKQVVETESTEEKTMK